MDALFDILEIILPSVIVFATAYFLMRQFFDNESQKRAAEVRASGQSLVTPIRLQAYERVVLFLERISPNSLVMRVNKSNTSARSFHSELVKTIRTEFEHNLSQQIYMSAPAWDSVRNAKEEIIKLINICSSKVSDSASGQDLAQVIIEATAGVSKLPNHMAIDQIKKEIDAFFGRP